jgi:hypothetical protein
MYQPCAKWTSIGGFIPNFDIRLELLKTFFWSVESHFPWANKSGLGLVPSNILELDRIHIMYIVIIGVKYLSLILILTVFTFFHSLLHLFD